MLQVCRCDSRVKVSPIQTEFTKVTTIYDYFQDKVYLLHVYITPCLTANFKQPPWSNRSVV
jgi:hypothetical protein